MSSAVGLNRTNQVERIVSNMLDSISRYFSIASNDFFDVDVESKFKLDRTITTNNRLCSFSTLQRFISNFEVRKCWKLQKGYMFCQKALLEFSRLKNSKFKRLLCTSDLDLEILKIHSRIEIVYFTYVRYCLYY